ncbi:MAG: DUF4126 domain-containing protein [Deltaproteobacteria bacterium]|nr:DUF4126 domain-containing protein [Deltaproteobacteria bacterium]
MEHLEPIIKTIALTMGVAWASGINLYAAILVLGVLGATANITLPPDLMILTDPLVITAAAVMYAVEFFADKIPGVDNGWDTVHTFIRIPLGALLAAAAVGEVNPPVAVAAALLGGSLAAATHVTKSGARVLINTSPEPFTNWLASLGEDAVVIAGLWTALHYPLLFMVLLLIFIVLIAILLPKIWRGVVKIFSVLRNLFRPKEEIHVTELDD